MTTVPEAMPHLPALRDFLISPGFGGFAVLAAAIIAACAVLYGIRRSGRRHEAQLEQEQRLHDEARAAEERTVKVAECWKRLTWLIERTERDPAAQAAQEAMLGVGPEFAAALVAALLRDAEEFGDDTLSTAIRKYQAQFALVLTQQAGPIPAGQTSATRRGRDRHAAAPRPTATVAGADAGNGETPAAAEKAAAGEGRRR